jgi:multiple sugar transport system ATP-binding protein
MTFSAKIDVVEQLGAEQYAYFQLEHEGVQSDELRELAEDAGADEVPSTGEGQVVARLESASEIKRGTEAGLWLDLTKLHFFDPSTGRNLAAS